MNSAASSPPSRLLLLLEAQRTLFEAMSLPAAAPILRRAPRGDGHPVLVLPGFTAGDGSTRVLRRYLKDRGYASHPWLLGQNLGPGDGLFKRLMARVDELASRYQQPISIVGWSLGGIYARELAKAAPDAVRQVVTLGSPFADAGRPSNVTRLFRRVSGNRTRERSEEFARSMRTPPSVPCSAIFSRSDGVVHWSACLEPETDHTENIEVVGSHCGLGLNPLVLYAVTDRLSQAPGAWKPFDRSGWRRGFYPQVPEAPDAHDAHKARPA